MRLTLFLPHLAVTGGLGVHCRSVLGALLRTAGQDSLTVLYPAEPQKLFPYSGVDPTWRSFLDHPKLHSLPIAWPEGRPLALPLDDVLNPTLIATRPDVVYCSYYTGFVKPPCPQAVTFHDAGFLESPHIFGDTATQRRATLTQMVPHLDRLLCISHDARERICRLLPFPENRTDVIWHGLLDAPEEFRSAGQHHAHHEPLWADGSSLADLGRYFFSPVGAATGFNRVRKNVPTAVAAFRAIGPSDVRFVIASTGILHERLLKELLSDEELKDGRHIAGGWQSGDGAIRVLPNLDRTPFLRAMAAAVGVVYPSRYEGFGLPVIEAMAVGTPVIASRATSLPEVMSEAGILVDPDDVVGFRDAMSQLRNESARREQLVRAGIERVKLFTLDRMGDKMWQALRPLSE